MFMKNYAPTDVNIDFFFFFFFFLGGGGVGGEVRADVNGEVKFL